MLKFFLTSLRPQCLLWSPSCTIDNSHAMVHAWFRQPFRKLGISLPLIKIFRCWFAFLAWRCCTHGESKNETLRNQLFQNLQLTYLLLAQKTETHEFTLVSLLTLYRYCVHFRSAMHAIEAYTESCNLIGWFIQIKNLPPLPIFSTKRFYSCDKSAFMYCLTKS